MPDVVRFHPIVARVLAVVGAVVLISVTLAGAALGQTEGKDESETPAGWTGSTFEPPFDVPDPVLRSQPFDVLGTLRYEKQASTEHIVRAEVRVVPVDPVSDTCVLPVPSVVPGPGPDPQAPVAELRVEVRDVPLGCNGRYVLEVEASLDRPDAPTTTLRRPFTLGVPPPGVTALAASLDEQERAVSLSFTPVPPEQLPPDAVGYVVERSRSEDPSPEEGWADIGDLGIADDPSFVDDVAAVPAGTYAYRVRTVSGRPGQELRSDPATAETAVVEIEEPPTSSTTSTRPRSAVVRRRAAASARRAATPPGRSTTITTLDNGFEGEIDYGTTADLESPDELDGDEPLAGQSVIQDEGEGVDLAGPVAGALVLLGWAGHVAYLNRLAKQL